MTTRGTANTLTGTRLSAIGISVLLVIGLAGHMPATASTEAEPQVRWWKELATGTWANFDGLPGEEVLIDALPGNLRGLRVDRGDGSLLWRYPASSEGVLPWVVAEVVGDLTGDGGADVVAVDEGTLFTLDGRSGDVLDRVAKLPFQTFARFIAPGDFDGDLLPDFLVRGVSSGGPVDLWAYSGGDLSVLWHITTDNWVDLAFGDADGEGPQEIALATGTGCRPFRSFGAVAEPDVWSVLLLDGPTGATRWSQDLPPESPPVGLEIASGKVVAKSVVPRPNDYCAKVVTIPIPPAVPVDYHRNTSAAPQGATQQVVSVLSGSDGKLAWGAVVPGGFTQDDGMAIASLSSDSKAVIIAAKQDGRQEVIKTVAGCRSPVVDLNNPGYTISSVTSACLGAHSAPNGGNYKSPYALHAFDLDSGVPLWVHESDVRGTGGEFFNNLLEIIPQPGGGDDIAYTSGRTAVLLSGSSGATRWSRQFTYARYLMGLSGQDIEGDGAIELVVEDELGWRAGLSPADGSELWWSSPHAGWTSAIAGSGEPGQPLAIVGDAAGGISGLLADGSKPWMASVGGRVAALASNPEEEVLAVVDGHGGGAGVVAGVGAGLILLSPRTGGPVKAQQVVALDARNGKILRRTAVGGWQYPTGGDFQGFPADALALSDLDGDGWTDATLASYEESDPTFLTLTVVAVSGRTGSRLWKHGFALSPQDGDAAYGNVSGLEVSDGTVVVTLPFPVVGGEVDTFGLDAMSGATRWERSYGAQMAVASTPEGAVILRDLEQPQLSAISSADGTKLWDVAVPEPRLEITAGDRLFLLSTAADQLEIEMIGLDGSTVTVEDKDLPGAVAATTTSDGGLVYSSAGGTFELSIEGLLRGEVVIRRQFRLPARSPAAPQDPEQPPDAADYPLVNQLLPIGTGEGHLLGWFHNPHSGRSPATWLARRL